MKKKYVEFLISLAESQVLFKDFFRKLRKVEHQDLHNNHFFIGFLVFKAIKVNLLHIPKQFQLLVRPFSFCRVLCIPCLLCRTVTCTSSPLLPGARLLLICIYKFYSCYKIFNTKTTFLHLCI